VYPCPSHRARGRLYPRITVARLCFDCNSRLGIFIYSRDFLGCSHGFEPVTVNFFLQSRVTAETQGATVICVHSPPRAGVFFLLFSFTLLHTFFNTSTQSTTPSLSFIYSNTTIYFSMSLNNLTVHSTYSLSTSSDCSDVPC